MSKVDFTKVEDILAAGLQKINVEHLCKLADIAAGIGHTGASARPSLSLEQKVLILGLKTDLVRLKKHAAPLYSRLNINKEQIAAQIETPASIDEEGWKKLSEFKAETGKLVKELFPDVDNESLIEEERKKHINKRFNVNDKWLPLR